MLKHSVAPASFLAPPKEFVLVNPDDAVMIVVSSPVELIVPATNTVSVNSAVDAITGEQIPGTLLVGDITDEGRLVWNAATGLRKALGISDTGEYAEGLGFRGLSVLPAGATRADIEEARAAGLVRLNRSRIESARATVNAQDEKNEIRRRLNMPLLPGDDEYVKASVVLGRLTESIRSETEERMAPMADDDAALLAFAKSKAASLAAKTDGDVAAVAAAIMEDPDAMKLMKQQYRTQQRSGKRPRGRPRINP